MTLDFIFWTLGGNICSIYKMDAAHKRYVLPSIFGETFEAHPLDITFVSIFTPSRYVLHGITNILKQRSCCFEGSGIPLYRY